MTKSSIAQTHKLFSQITQPRHCLHHLLPPKTSTHCPYSLRKRQHYYQLPQVEYSQYKNSFITRCLFNVAMTFDMTVVIICSCDDEFGYWLYWHYYRFFAFSMYYCSSLYVFTTHVTVCVCHTEIKGYLLSYFMLQYSEKRITDCNSTNISGQRFQALRESDLWGGVTWTSSEFVIPRDDDSDSDDWYSNCIQVSSTHRHLRTTAENTQQRVS